MRGSWRGSFELWGAFEGGGARGEQEVSTWREDGLYPLPLHF